MDKTIKAAAAAVADIGNGASLAVGGFGLCGIPHVLIKALYEHGARQAGDRLEQLRHGEAGLGLLLRAGRVRRTVSSYVGENKEFARQYLSGELELELCPAGHARRAAARRRRRHPRLLHPGRRRHARSPRAGCPGATPPTARSRSPRRPRRSASSAAGDYVLERGIVTDFALVRAGKGRPARQPRFQRVRPQLQPAGRDGRADHHRRGRAAGRARRARPGRRSTCPGCSSSASWLSPAGRGQGHREADHPRSRH